MRICDSIKNVWNQYFDHFKWHHALIIPPLFAAVGLGFSWIATWLGWEIKTLLGRVHKPNILSGTDKKTEGLSKKTLREPSYKEDLREVLSSQENISMKDVEIADRVQILKSPQERIKELFFKIIIDLEFKGHLKLTKTNDTKTIQGELISVDYDKGIVIIKPILEKEEIKTKLSDIQSIELMTSIPQIQRSQLKEQLQGFSYTASWQENDWILDFLEDGALIATLRTQLTSKDENLSEDPLLFIDTLVITEPS